MLRTLFFSLSLILFSQVTIAYEVTGKVVGVSDGDTIKVLTPEKEVIKVRLAEIDTPEKAQPYGQKAKQALSDAVYGQQVTLDIETTDRYGRKVAQVFTHDNWVNGALVVSGYAWVYRKYAKTNKERLLNLEQQAKAAKRGLWSLPEAQIIPPWQWRRGSREKGTTNTFSSNSSLSKSTSSSKACGSKTKCGQMSSCSEAKFYLNSCGVTRLDRDRDGIPCESICK